MTTHQINHILSNRYFFNGGDPHAIGMELSYQAESIFTLFDRFPQRLAWVIYELKEIIIFEISICSWIEFFNLNLR